MENNQYQHIPQEKFAFAQLDAELKDKKLETKARGYMADALLRFKKNKSSVVAAYIILLAAMGVGKLMRKRTAAQPDTDAESTSESAA